MFCTLPGFDQNGLGDLQLLPSDPSDVAPPLQQGSVLISPGKYAAGCARD